MCEEEDHVARERSGHTAVVDEHYLYIWGGYLSVEHDEVFLPSDEIWLYDLETGLWLKHKMCGMIPPSMSGASGCIVNGLFYIFGGCGDDGQTNEHYSVDLKDGKYTWKKLTHRSGSLPSPRDKLTCWVYKGRMIYFGGYGHKHLNDIKDPKSFVVDEASWADEVVWGWNNEIHEFDPENFIWTEPRTFGRRPAPRAAHAGATIGSKGYVCGGRIKEMRTSDLFCMDLNSWTWSEIVPSTSSVPLGRSWHSLTAISDTSLFLFGGLSLDCRPMSDAWIYNLETKEWNKMEHPNQDKPRLWHTANEGKDSDVIVFGGSHDYILLVDKGHSKDVLIFQTQPYPLIRLCKDFIASHVGVFQNQIYCLPAKLRHDVHKRTHFIRTRNQCNVFV